MRSCSVSQRISLRPSRSWSQWNTKRHRPWTKSLKRMQMLEPWKPMLRLWTKTHSRKSILNTRHPRRLRTTTANLSPVTAFGPATAAHHWQDTERTRTADGLTNVPLALARKASNVPGQDFAHLRGVLR